MDITKKQKLVLRAIKEYPGCENDDAMLIAAVWKLEGWDDTRGLLENIRRVTRPETITRRRRELANMGLINYSDKRTKEIAEAAHNELEAHSNYKAVPWL